MFSPWPRCWARSSTARRSLQRWASRRTVSPGSLASPANERSSRQTAVSEGNASGSATPSTERLCTTYSPHPSNAGYMARFHGLPQRAKSSYRRKSWPPTTHGAALGVPILRPPGTAKPQRCMPKDSSLSNRRLGSGRWRSSACLRPTRRGERSFSSDRAGPCGLPTLGSEAKMPGARRFSCMRP